MAHDGDEVRVTIRPVASLLPHEETIPSHVQQVAEQVTRDGVQKDPVIVDSASGAVLDGMHRLAAFASLGLQNVVCSIVDYSSQSIGLLRWARVYSGPGEASLRSTLEGLGAWQKRNTNDGFRMLESKESTLIALVGGGCYLPSGPGRLEEGFDMVRKIDSASGSAIWRRTFISEDEIDVPINEGENLVVLVQRLGKQDVVQAALTGRLFPCKTSLHTIESRPVAVNFPLGELNGATTGTLRERLKGTNRKTLPRGSLYGGRRYKESLLLLND